MLIRREKSTNEEQFVSFFDNVACGDTSGIDDTMPNDWPVVAASTAEKVIDDIMQISQSSEREAEDNGGEYLPISDYVIFEVTEHPMVRDC